MPKFTIESSALVGFAAEKGEGGKEEVKVQTKCSLITSDDPVFHIWMKNISSLFFQNTTVPIPFIHKFIILLHADNNADIYINDFEESLMVQVKESVQKGDMVPLSNISDIKDLVFPNIKIETDDVVIYGVRNDWRFSLYFNFERKVNVEVLSQELGRLKKEAFFYSLLASTNAKIDSLDLRGVNALIFTEGKSDWKHLSNAIDKLENKLDVAFFINNEDRGSDDLYRMCEHYAEVPQHHTMIFIFDRDEEKILKSLREKEKPGESCQEWGNNVFSLYLPVPRDRSDNTHAISIEFFYTDSEITTANKDGRRLFLSNEFSKKTGNHTSGQLHCTALNKVGSKKVKVIDSEVFDHNDKSMALSKDSFAEAIINHEDEFKNFDFSAFEPILETIDKIINKKN